jgi:hypothetical protein
VPPLLSLTSFQANWWTSRSWTTPTTSISINLKVLIKIY